MPFCGACNTFILGGGKSHGGKRYCNDKCLELGRSKLYAGEIPDEIVAKRAWQMRDAACTCCGGPGPIDFQNSQQVVSVFVLTQTTNTTVYGCKSCGNRATIRATAITLFAGWWGVPWGVILTPISLVTNLSALLQPSPPGPSVQLLEAAKIDLASKLRRRVAALSAQSTPPTALATPDHHSAGFPAIGSQSVAAGIQPTYTPAPTSGLAITSLVFAILSIFAVCLLGLSLITSIVAVVTGHLALKQIKTSHGQLTGNAMAKSGLVIGYVMLLFSLIWVGILIFSLSQPDRRQRPELPRPDWAQPDWAQRRLPEPPRQIPTAVPVRPDSMVPPVQIPASQPNAAYQPPVIAPREARQHVAQPQEPLPPYVVHAFANMGWAVKSLAFSPDKRLLAVGKTDAKVMVYDLVSGKLAFEIGGLEQELSGVTNVVFSQDGKRVIATGDTGAVATWSIDESGVLTDHQSLTSQADAIRVLQTSPVSNFLITGSSRGQLVWQPITSIGNNNFRQLDALPHAIMAIHLPKSGMRALASDGRALLAIDLKSAQALRTELLQAQSPFAAAFSQDGSRLAISSGYTISVWDTAAQTQVLAIDTNHEIQWCVGFMPDGKRIYSGGSGQVLWWDSETGELQSRLKVIGDLNIKEIAISADSQWIATVPDAAGQTLAVMQIPD